MYTSLLYKTLVLLVACIPNLLAARPRAATLNHVEDFGSNPTGAGMFTYIPSSNLAASPPIIVAIHYCGGTAQAYYDESPYAQLADQYGFIVIYPSSPYRHACWDVSSKESLTNNGDGDSNSIANMVTYALAKYNGDATKVFVTGSSSGAMMTNVLAATYPSLFAAATAYSGVPAGCFVSSYRDEIDGWNGSCAQGHVPASSRYWANTVYAMDPRYSGPRPRMQIYHGDIDTTLLPRNYNETIKQWTGVFGYKSTNPRRTRHNFPHEGYTTSIWGVDARNPLGMVQGIYAHGVGHTVPINGTQDMAWFGLGPYASSSSSSSSNDTTAIPHAWATGTVRHGGGGGGGGWHTSASIAAEPEPSYAGA